MHLIGDHVDEGVRARGQDEYQPGAGLARQAGGGRVGPVIETPRDRADASAVCALHTRAAMQDAVDRRRADAGLARHVDEARWVTIGRACAIPRRI